MPAPFITGILPAGGFIEINVGNLSTPMTAALHSSAGGRKIELSAIGAEYFQPIYDANTATMLAVAIMSPMGTVKITGQAGDDYCLRSNG